MKNPNGFGSIIKLGGNRRKPYAVRVTVGWDDEGKQIKKYVGFYENKKDALEQLVLYNQNPLMIETNKITFKEVYEKWSVQKFPTICDTNITSYKAVFKYCEALYNIPMVEIKTNALVEVLDKIPTHYATKKKCKNLFNQLFDYAMKNDIVQKNYASYVPTPKKDTVMIERTIFTNEEIEKLFNAVSDIDFVDTILIMIFTGIRIGELLSIETKNVNLEDNYFVCGIKTEAGKNRLVPIHSKILPFFKNRYNPNNEYLIVNKFGKQMTYSNYKREKFDLIMKQLKMSHNPHDCRHTFATLMYKAEADKTSIRKLVGHNSYITTEKIYTHTDIETLKKAVDLI